MRKWWVAAGLLVWFGATAFAFGITYEGVTATPVHLRLTDGTSIYGTLYRSGQTEGPGAIVLHGTAVAHDSCGPGLSIPLARAGLVVLAIDLRGHGRSGGELPRQEFGTLGALQNCMAEHAEVDAAIDFLHSQPFVTSDKIALVGHSRGGWVGACVGSRRPDIACVVAVSSAPTVGSRQQPRNLLMLAAGLDDVIPQSQYDSALDHALAGQGNLKECEAKNVPEDARAVTVATWCLHLTTLAAGSVTERVTEWVAWSYYCRAPPVSRWRLAQAWWANNLATAAALVVAAAVASMLARRLCPLPAAPAACSLRPAKALMLLPVLLTAPLAVWLADLLPDGGFLFSNHAVAFLGVAALLVGCAGRFAGRMSQGEVNAPSIGRGIILGFVNSGLVLCLLAGTWSTTWLQGAPSPRRLVATVLMIAPLLLCSSALAAWTPRLLGPTPPTWTGAVFRGVAWLAMCMALWVSHVALMRSERPLLAIPALLVAVSGVVPLPLVLLPDRPGLGVARAVSHAVATACFLGWHLPFVCG